MSIFPTHLMKFDGLYNLKTTKFTARSVKFVYRHCDPPKWKTEGRGESRAQRAVGTLNQMFRDIATYQGRKMPLTYLHVIENPQFADPSLFKPVQTKEGPGVGLHLNYRGTEQLVRNINNFIQSWLESH